MASSAQVRARQDLLRAQGLCERCGKRPLFVTRLCRRCRDTDNRRRRSRYAARVGRPVRPYTRKESA